MIVIELKIRVTNIFAMDTNAAITLLNSEKSSDFFFIAVNIRILKIISNKLKATKIKKSITNNIL